VGITGMAVTSYICLRALEIRPWLSASGAIAFTVSGYFQVRALNHDFLSIYISAAFGATLAIMIGQMTDEIQFRRRLRSPFFIVAMIVIATSGLYYAMFSLMMIGFATVVFTARTKQFRSIAIMSGISALVLVALFVGALGPNLPLLLSGAPKRAPHEQFWHGLFSIRCDILRRLAAVGSPARPALRFDAANHAGR
jgi:hypothetical protein